MEPTFLFGGWEAIARIAFITTGGYIALVILLRVAGWRRLTQMSGFDFIVAVTIGSAFGRMLTAREVGLLDAVVTFTVLLMLQQAVAWLQQRSPRFGSLIRAKPVLVCYQGRILEDVLSEQRLREAELMQAVRAQGLGSVAEAEAIVLEPDGSFSVVQRNTAGDGSAVTGITQLEARR
jgi:uncharacterized membrane protein YcaP (DUF421 family)